MDTSASNAVLPWNLNSAGNGILTADGGAVSVGNKTSTTAFGVYGGSVPAGYFYNDVTRSVLDLENTSTVTNANSYGSYVLNNAVHGSGATSANAVGYFGVGISNADHAHTWGINYALDDALTNGAITTLDRQIIGEELDLTVNGTATVVEGLSTIIQGTAQPTAANAFQVGNVGSVQWVNGFVTNNGAVNGAAAIFGATAASGTSIASQFVDFAGFDAGTVGFYSQLSALNHTLKYTDNTLAHGISLAASATTPTITPNGSGTIDLGLSGNGATSNVDILSGLSIQGPTTPATGVAGLYFGYTSGANTANIYAINQGTAYKLLQIDASSVQFGSISSGGVQIGAPTGGDKGSGTLNAAGLIYNNGTAPTGSSGGYVLATSPTLTTPILGVASATSVNKWVFTAPTTAATLTAGADNLTYTGPTTSQTLVGTTATQTLTNKTVTDLINQSFHVSTADFSSSGTGLASIAGLSQSLTAAGLYNCHGYVHFTTAPTGSNGFKIALATSDTLTVNQMRFFATALNSAAFVASGTGTSTALGTAADNVLAAATDLLLEGIINVNAAGTLQVQLAENTASGSIAVLTGNASWSCNRAA